MTQLVMSDTSLVVLEYMINTDLSVLSSWFVSNYLHINATKTQAMVTGPSTYSFDFKVDNITVQSTDTLKILGIRLDQKLTCRDHVSEQVKRACAKVTALRILRRFIPLDVMCCLYKAYVLPHLEYCSPIILCIIQVLLCVEPLLL